MATLKLQIPQILKPSSGLTAKQGLVASFIIEASAIKIGRAREEIVTCRQGLCWGKIVIHSCYVRLEVHISR